MPGWLLAAGCWLLAAGWGSVWHGFPLLLWLASIVLVIIVGPEREREREIQTNNRNSNKSVDDDEAGAGAYFFAQTQRVQGCRLRAECYKRQC